jgi:FkbM family methyltransferase
MKRQAIQILKFFIPKSILLQLSKYKKQLNKFVHVSFQNWERKVITEIKWKKRAKNFYSKFITQDSLCFDIGANIGNRVGIFLNLGAKVVAVEPQKKCQEELIRKFGNRIVLIKKGLGSKEGTAEFFESNAHTLSSFSLDWINSVKRNRFKEYTWQSSGQIELTTLDSMILTYGNPDFVKIDVEGYESEVLKGLTKELKCLSFEYTVPERITSVVSCLNQMRNISDQYLCNYSVGESFEFSLDTWIPINKFIHFVQENHFVHSSFGDIYIRPVSNSSFDL